MAIYHLHLSHGSRAGGQSASAKADYITRDGRYAERSGLSHTESINMPSWADTPQAFWRGADEWSRANGRLFTEVEVALPAELSQAEQVELVREWAKRMTNHPDGKIPCTWAIHDANTHNPHAHIVLSSRVDDGLVRADAQTWFSRAASGKKPPEQGGARSWSEATNKDWLEALRKGWGQVANRALERAGHQERIDHRSLAKQDEQKHELLRREPTRHVGWAQQKRQEIRRHNERVGVTRRMQRELVDESQDYHRQVKLEQTAKEALQAKRERVAKANQAPAKPTPQPSPPEARKPVQEPPKPTGPTQQQLDQAQAVRAARDALEACKARQAKAEQQLQRLPSMAQIRERADAEARGAGRRIGYQADEQLRELQERYTQREAETRRTLFKRKPEHQAELDELQGQMDKARRSLAWGEKLQANGLVVMSEDAQRKALASAETTLLQERQITDPMGMRKTAQDARSATVEAQVKADDLATRYGPAVAAVQAHEQAEKRAQEQERAARHAAELQAKLGQHKHWAEEERQERRQGPSLRR